MLYLDTIDLATISEHLTPTSGMTTLSKLELHNPELGWFLYVYRKERLVTSSRACLAAGDQDGEKKEVGEDVHKKEGKGEGGAVAIAVAVVLAV